jgi:hypothetical protein
LQWVPAEVAQPPLSKHNLENKKYRKYHWEIM